jgi:hypothetical protein
MEAVTASDGCLFLNSLFAQVNKCTLFCIALGPNQLNDKSDQTGNFSADRATYTFIHSPIILTVYVIRHTLTGGPTSPLSPLRPFFPSSPGGPGGPIGPAHQTVKKNSNAT